MRFLPVILFTLLASAVHGQPFAIGTTDITFFDALRNRNIDCELHYPADMPGTGVAVSSGVFPVLVIGHGFVMTVDAYTYLWQHYVPLGYIVALPKTEGGIAPDHEAFGEDLAFIASAMQVEHTDGSSIFFGHVSPATALMGHSMGGGAAFLGAAGNSSIQTLVTFAPAETNPSAIMAAAQVQVPSLVFTANEDCVTPMADHAQPMYDALPVACKAYVNITGGGHCYFGDPNTLCSFGEFTCAPNLSISRGEQHDVVTDVTDLWLDIHLQGSSATLNVLLDSLASSPRYLSENTCLSTSVTERPDPGFTASWIAGNSDVLLSGVTPGAEIAVINMWGQVVARSIASNSMLAVAMGGQAAGMYQVRHCVAGRCTTRAVMLLH